MTESVAVVFNPVAQVDSQALRADLARRGIADPIWLETTKDSPGAKQTREALDRGAQLVLVCGGDGTVAECAGELVGSGVPMGLIPSGTGNLLARNLDLPLDRPSAVDVAARRRVRALDVLEADGRRFVVMAGLGFDAAMIRHTNDEAKKYIGWLAYVVGAFKAYRRAVRPVFTIEVDGEPAVTARALGVIVGNVGRLQAGLTLLPDADPYDGQLDVIVLSPNRTRDIPVLLWRLVRKRPTAGPQAHVIRGRRVQIRAATGVPVEYDGDGAGETSELSVVVLPGAVQVCV